MKLCKTCNQPFEPRGVYGSPGQYRCRDCRNELDKQYDKNRRRNHHKREPILTLDGEELPSPASNFIREKVTVVGTDPTAPMEVRNDIRCSFYQRMFDYMDFRLTTEMGYFDGAMVVFGERKYYVRLGKMVEASA